MILIAHKGNILGKSDFENHPSHIYEAFSEGYDVEVDAWYVDRKWFFGHNKPQYNISTDFILQPGLWIHCKNIDALSRLVRIPTINCFFHSNDDVVLTSKGYLWTYPGKKLCRNSICVLPEKVVAYQDVFKCAGICSDFIGRYKIDEDDKIDNS